MSITFAKNSDAIRALDLVKGLQKRFVDKLDNLSLTLGEQKNFEEFIWERDKGTHGGGNRFEGNDNILFNRASVNVSQVHYEENDKKALQSATAISTIIHPNNSKVPSVHIHISLTQLRNGKSYWRIMADLNPSIISKEDSAIFLEALKILSKESFEEGIKQGDKYFFIPALNRHRGVCHFYLENYKTADDEKDFEFARRFGEGIIDTYIEIITNAYKTRNVFSVNDIKEQLNYHTLYLFQVLTLDRGTTSGLLVHNQNDIGIMGSLPSFVNKELLKSWAIKVEKPQDELVISLANAINDRGEIDIKTKEKLANIVRNHYKKYPEALKYQASGNIIPNTVSNHTN